MTTPKTLEEQHKEEVAEWRGGFIIFASIVALFFLMQIPVVTDVVSWIFSYIILPPVLILGLLGFISLGPLVVFLKLILWPIAGILAMFRRF